jgi:hypothetical protein
MCKLARATVFVLAICLLKKQALKTKTSLLLFAPHADSHISSMERLSSNFHCMGSLAAQLRFAIGMTPGPPHPLVPGRRRLVCSSADVVPSSFVFCLRVPLIPSLPGHVLPMSHI